MKLGRLRQDGDGHWYCVPECDVTLFDRYLETLEGKEYLEAAGDYDDFNAQFGMYRIDGYKDVVVLTEMPK